MTINGKYLTPDWILFTAGEEKLQRKSGQSVLTFVRSADKTGIWAED